MQTANTLADGFRAIEGGLKPDAILLDLNLPDVDGVDGLIRMRARVPDTPVVVISSHDDDRIISTVLQAGAAGFISKQSARDKLEEALRRIWAGETYAPPSYQPAPRDAGRDRRGFDRELLQTLTPQQGRILQLVCEGKLNKQIAYDMSIAETTVKAHITGDPAQAEGAEPHPGGPDRPEGAVHFDLATVGKPPQGRKKHRSRGGLRPCS